MLLRKAWFLQQTIVYHRKKKDEIAQRKELSSLEGVRVSNQLNYAIVEMQRLMRSEDGFQKDNENGYKP
ncbi:hypothetical protein [Peribacillus simplex]|uniref:hypothetical protein n=1 Tax=Peribacillus simplex TaxID=1478 RepID=UPI00366BDE5B